MKSSVLSTLRRYTRFLSVTIISQAWVTYLFEGVRLARIFLFCSCHRGNINLPNEDDDSLSMPQ
jgi:hypothetical protein